MHTRPWGKRVLGKKRKQTHTAGAIDSEKKCTVINYNVWWS